MIVIIHEHKAMDEDSKTVMIVFEDCEESYSVSVVTIYLSSFIADTISLSIDR
jgi:hypothetical protein